MQAITTIGLDIAKSVFQVAALSAGAALTVWNAPVVMIAGSTASYPGCHP